MVIFVENEFYQDRIFVIHYIFYISIKPWRVPTVKNNCFIRDEITHNVQNGFIKRPFDHQC